MAGLTTHLAYLEYPAYIFVLRSIYIGTEKTSKASRTYFLEGQVAQLRVLEVPSSGSVLGVIPQAAAEAEAAVSAAAVWGYDRPTDRPGAFVKFKAQFQLWSQC